MPELTATLSLLLPILLPGVALIVVLKQDWLSALGSPVDRGIRLAGQPLLGKSKTWRGVAVYLVGAVLVCLALALPALAAAVAVPFQRYPPVLLGLALGGGYCLGEFANSFVKRRLGIPPSGRSGWRRFQLLIDLGDGILIVVLVYLALGTPLAQAGAAGLAGLFIHLMTDAVMRRLELKEHQ